LEIIELLLANGAEIDARGCSKRTPLYTAIETKKFKAARLLLERGADVNAQYCNYSTALDCAIRTEGLEAVLLLLEYGADINQIISETQFTGLGRAIADNREDVVNAFLEHGADINVKNSFAIRNTSLTFAFARNKMGIAKLIVNHIAKLEVAGLYVSEENLQLKNKLKDPFQPEYNSDIANSYRENLQKCHGEIKKLGKENKLLHDFLKQSDTKQLVSIWEESENLRDQLDDTKSLKEQYPEYAHILINKANDVKKEIFLHNHKPLIDVLSKHYGRNFDYMNFAGIKTFFEAHRHDLRQTLNHESVTLINFVDLEDVKIRHDPETLKVRALAETIKNNSVLDNPNTEQHQTAGLSLN
jgi:hypothetical protein